MLRAQEIIQVALEIAGLADVPEDSGVIFDTGRPIRRAMFGVDMEAAEIIIAKQLGYDAVITHHPKGGYPMVNLYQVMENQIDRMVQAGVPINKAQKALSERKDEVERSLHAANYDRAVAAARVLEMTFIAIHTPADIIAEHGAKTFGPIVKLTQKQLWGMSSVSCEIPEYARTAAGPKVQWEPKTVTPARSGSPWPVVPAAAGRWPKLILRRV